MTRPHALRLVPLAQPAAALHLSTALKWPELRLRVMTSEEEPFGTEWRRALEKHSADFVRYRSSAVLLEHLAAECRYVGLVGIGPNTESNVFENIAATAEPVRRRLVLVASAVSEHLANRLHRVGVGDFVTTATSVDEVIVRLELQTLRLSGAKLPRASEIDATPEQTQCGLSIDAEATGQAHRVKLSPIESRLYALFARRFAEAISREEILRVVRDRETRHAKNSNIVDVYVRYLRVKLARAAPHLKIATVRDVGYGMCDMKATLESEHPKNTGRRSREPRKRELTGSP